MTRPSHLLSSTCWPFLSGLLLAGGLVPRDSLTTLLALIITGVWAVVALVSLYTKEYAPLGAITPVMLLVAGFLFGYRTGGHDGDQR